MICGGIGTGKSVVSRILRLKGYGVFDCDSEAKALMESDCKLMESLKAIAGEDIYTPAGYLNRRMLAARIYTDEEMRQDVNRAVHKAVREALADWAREASENRFVETAIAAESGIAETASELWIVKAPLEERIRRVRERDGRPEKEILRIIGLQDGEEELLKRSGKKIMEIWNGENDCVLSQINRLIS